VTEQRTSSLLVKELVAALGQQWAKLLSSTESSTERDDDAVLSMLVGLDVG
jgi:hypothetical protein